MAEWREVASLERLTSERRVVVRLGGREIGVLADPDGGEPRAIRNRCPHAGAPLGLGRVEVRGTGTPGHYECGTEQVIRCPWHGWEFGLADGRCPDDARMRVAVYPVRVVSGTVEVYA